MKPLVNKNIPLYVKSFFKPAEPGSIVHNFEFMVEYVPVIIAKENQVLVTVSSLDLSFIAEEHIAKVYHLLSELHMKVNIVQQSAMSLSFAIDRPERNLDKLVQELHQYFKVRYNEDLELITIRNYDLEVIHKMTRDRIIFVEQKNKKNSQISCWGARGWPPLNLNHSNAPHP